MLLCLAWGVLATPMVSQHAPAARDVSASDETLSLDAQQIYHSLADADVTVSTAYLYGRVGPFADRQRYLRDIAGIIVLAVLMAVGCAWRLTVRLTEYR
jgi:hypothetical protein